ncbi:MAG: RsmD family RNA methyltransferase [Bacteriovoracaceae bacterium]
MSIQILGGLARGRTLSVPTGDLIRPTSVMLRRRLFDARQDLSQNTFYDLCAGSGAVGIEAWSRGAYKVILSEKNRHVLNILLKNMKMMKEHYADELALRPITTQNQDCLKFIKQWMESYQALSLEEQQSTILFFDPPYEDHQLYLNVLDQFQFNSLGWFKGELWLESDETKGVREKELLSLQLPIVKKYVQGTSFVVIIKGSS